MRFKNMLPRYILYTLAVLAALSLTGCGWPAPKPKLFGRPGALNIAINLNEEEWAVFRNDIFPRFKKEYKTKIKAYQIEPDKLAAKLESLEKTGKSEIDVFAQDIMSLAVLIDKDMALDLSEYEGQIPKETFPNIIESCKYNDKLMFMPFRPEVQIVYYNEDAFRTYNISMPKKWEELIKIAQKFKESEGRGRILLNASGGNPAAIQIYEFILQADGDPYSFDDIGCVQAFGFLQNLWRYTSEESQKADWGTASDILAKQQAYLVQNRPSEIAALRKRRLPFVFRTYSGWGGAAGEHHVIGGDVFGIPKTAANKEIALEFIRYMQSKEIQEILVSKLNWPSIRQDAYGLIEDWQKPHFEAILKAMVQSTCIKNITWWPSYTKYITEAFREIVINGAPVEETLKKYKLELEEEKSCSE